jgi:hypothetical protein
MCKVCSFKSETSGTSGTSKMFYHGYNEDKIGVLINLFRLNLDRPEDFDKLWRCVVADLSFRWIEADRMYDETDDISKALDEVEKIIRCVRFQKAAYRWIARP